MPAANSATVRSTSRCIARNIALARLEAPLEPAQFLADGAGGLGFHGAIRARRLAAERCDARPAAATAADGGLDHRLAKLAVQGLHEWPGASVGHALAARRRRDRPGGVDALDQFRLARPHGRGPAPEHA